MHLSEDTFDSFRSGMAAGHQVGQSRDLLYAVGFVAGFVWGFFSGAEEEASPVEAMPRGA